ncbi:hypothetical protein D9M72_429370 [compost metagenome]
MPSFSTLPKFSQTLAKLSGSFSASFSIAVSTRLVTPLRILASSGLSWIISRETFKGRSDVSTRPRTKRR